jgi:siroheme synthase-like protein
MIAPMISADVPEQVRQVRECYRPEHIEQAGIVFAATNVAEVNDAVVRDARARGILVSRADSDDEFPGDFVTPARLDRSPIIVAISAGSAALSVMIRDGLAARWDARWTDLAQAMVQLRPEIIQRWSEATRREIFRELASAEALDVLAATGIEGLRDWMRQRHLEDRGPATGAGT